MSNAVYKNQAAISPSFDADVKCGTGLVLGASNDLSFEVPTGQFILVYDDAVGGFIQYDHTGTEVTP